MITYFIQAVDGGPIKIGRSRDGGQALRLTSLQIGNPSWLMITHTLEGDHEKELHDRFASARLVGEWFAPVQELVELARALPPSSDDADNARVTAFVEGWSAALEHVYGHLRTTLTEKVCQTLDDELDSDRADAELHATDARRAINRPRTAHEGVL